MPTLYIAVTNHGFGHATRAASVAAYIRDRCQEADIPLTLIMATTAPKWLLDSYLKGDYIHREVRFDIGVLQSDSLHMDKPATLRVMQEILANQEELIAQEAEFMSSAGVDLVLADIPPLMGKIAKAAGVPCWMMGNFGWDFIYRDWGAEYPGFIEIADWIAECCSHAQRTFRMPFHAPMTAFANVTDIGLTGGAPAHTQAYLRSLMKSDVPPERTVLLTFGGLGLSKIPYEALAKFPDWQFVTFDHHAPDLPNLYEVGDRTMRPVDWMIVCDRIVSKPGYSTFAEACLLDKGVITITREGFAEAQILLDGIQNYAPHRIVAADDFFNGDWSFLTEPLLPSRQSKALDKSGNHTISTAVLKHFQC
ncbi:MAG: glycosyl transferase [Cyanobacteria bacterium J06627_28]